MPRRIGQPELDLRPGDVLTGPVVFRQDRQYASTLVARLATILRDPALPAALEANTPEGEDLRRLVAGSLKSVTEIAERLNGNNA